jgi:endonuclease/exonuclease/phosphatase family metal-dependent hydrolase
MLRVATLNLNYRMTKHGAWDARRTLIVDAIQRAQADVVALQAVEGANGSSQAAELAALLKYEYVVYVAADAKGEVSHGSAFIARRTLRDIGVRRLSLRAGLEDSNQRVVIRARVDAEGGPIDLYNTHFSWVPAQALDNAQETIAFRTPGGALLLGDLNSAADSPPLRVLQDAGFVDLWTALRPAEPGPTFEADAPAMRIDYALASGAVRARAQSMERVGTECRAVPRLSDHLGLLVTLGDATAGSRQ